MREDIKTEWVRRCKSGTRKQGTGWLKTVSDDGTVKYCCLGILCEQAEEAGVVKSRIQNGIVEFYDPDDTDDYSGELLPGKVTAWAELDLINPRVDYQGDPTPLSSVNDDGTPFDEIGDLIADQL